MARAQFLRERLASARRRLDACRSELETHDRTLSTLSTRIPKTTAAPAPHPAPAPKAEGRRPALLRWGPYAVLMAGALSLAPRIPHAVETAAPREPAVYSPVQERLPAADDELTRTALAMVYDFRPRGLEETVLDLLGPQERPGVSTWEVQPLTKELCLVRFGPAADGRFFEFEADLKEGLVQATPDTTVELRRLALTVAGR